MTELNEAKRLLRYSRKEERPLTIVLTGCSSGIGLYASKLLRLVSPKSTLFLVARTQKKATTAKREVESTLNGSQKLDNIIPMECDQTCLKSVTTFCAGLRLSLQQRSATQGGDGECGIDVLSLNAAVLVSEDSEAVFTADDLEVTFQTNHLSGFLISNLLFDLMNPGGRVVVTTSGLSAFSSFNGFSGAIDPNSMRTRKRFEMIDGSEFDYKKSYAASKLCCVAFCMELNRRLQKLGAIAVCFTPGLIPTSGLFRHQKQWKDTLEKKRLVGMDETVEWGGSMLAWMLLSDEAGKHGGAYWRAPFGISRRGGKIPDDLFMAPVNDEAFDHEKRVLLWKISADLAGVPGDFVPDIE